MKVKLLPIFIFALFTKIYGQETPPPAPLPEPSYVLPKIKENYYHHYYPLPDLPADVEKDTVERHERRLLINMHRNFPGCEDVEKYQERYLCSKKKLEKYIYDYLVYPDSAWQNDIEGIVIAKFMVERDGTVHDPQLVYNIGYGCGEEVIRLINEMPPFDPGIARGHPIKNTKYISVQFSKFDYFIRRAHFLSN